MEQILYTSRATATVSAGDVFRIIQSSARNNPDREVTGFLAYAGDMFLQVVEGPREKLDELLGVIARDPRHTAMKILSRQQVAQHAFPDWRMQRFDISHGDIAPMTLGLRAHGAPSDLIEQVERQLGLCRAAA